MKLCWSFLFRIAYRTITFEGQFQLISTVVCSRPATRGGKGGVFWGHLHHPKFSKIYLVVSYSNKLYRCPPRKYRLVAAPVRSVMLSFNILPRKSWTDSNIACCLVTKHRKPAELLCFRLKPHWEAKAFRNS